MDSRSESKIKALATALLARENLLERHRISVLPKYAPAHLRSIERVLTGEGIWRSNSEGSFRLIESFRRKIFNANYVLPVASATAALHCVLAYYVQKRSGKILLSGWSWYSVLAMALQTGAVPEFIDLEIPTLRLRTVNSLCEVACLVTSHLFGIPSLDLDTIQQMRTAGIPIVEDCAQCVQGRIGRYSVGQVGEVSIFSFNGSKQIPCGEGGLIATNDSDLASFCENFVLSVCSPQRPVIKRFNSGTQGWNYRLSAISASLSAALIDDLDERLADSLDVADGLARCLRSFDSVNVLGLPREHGCFPWGLPFLVVKIKNNMSPQDSRALLFYMLRLAGIPVSVWVPEIFPRTELYNRVAQTRGLQSPARFDLPSSSILAERHLVLPTAPNMLELLQSDTLSIILELYETA